MTGYATYTKMLEIIDQKMAGAREGRQAWTDLREVVEKLQAVQTRAIGTNGAPVELRKVRMEGVLGISNPLTLYFHDSGPGLTVIYGSNGSGKSSIASAIQVGLAGGSPHLEQPVGGGRAPLWNPTWINAENETGHIEIELARGDAALLLRATLGGTESQADRAASWEGPAELRDAAGTFPPVKSYASFERKIRLSADLKDFLHLLINLGPEIAEVESHVDQRLNNTREAQREINQAWVALEEATSVAMKQFPDANVLGQLERPDIASDPQAWYLKVQAELGGESQVVSSSLVAQLRHLSQRVQEEVAGLGLAGDEGNPRLWALMQGILELHHDVDLGPNCPLCQSQVEWVAMVQHIVREKESITRAHKIAEEILAEFEGVASELLDGIDVGGVADEIGELATHLREFRNSSTRPRLELQAKRNITLKLVDYLTSPAGSDAMARLEGIEVQISGLRSAQRPLIREYRSVWELHWSDANDYSKWFNAARMMGRLREVIVEEAAKLVTTRADVMVSRLLDDAGLRVSYVDVKKTKAELKLKDADGRDVPLGYLSAGQRNALLLGLQLVSANSGPFGFVVLDDPVHAFDDVRLDLLASSLAELGEAKRVIVLTHDQRLVDQLQVRVKDLDLRRVTRDRQSSQVEVAPWRALWEEYLIAASQLLAGYRQGQSVPPAVTTPIRNLCRLAVDDALRQFVLQWSLSVNDDPVAHLNQLDSEYTTKGRLRFVQDLTNGRSDAVSLEALSKLFQEYGAGWNHASHGNEPVSETSGHEVKAVEFALKNLMR